MKNITKKLCLILALSLLFVSTISALSQTSIFFDGLEVNNFATIWTNDANNKFSRSATTVYAGTNAILADGGIANAKLTLVTGLNITNQTVCNLTYVMRIQNTFGNGEYLCMDYSSDNGATWNRDAGSDGTAGGVCQDGNLDTENAWRNISYSFSSPGINSFKIRFRINTNANTKDGFIDNINLTCTYDSSPTLGNITASNTLIKGGDTLTIYANTTTHGVNDTEQGTLYLYCDSTTTPNATNTDCLGGTISDSTYPYDLTCAITTPLTNANNTQYCRIYDGSSYSSAVALNYTTDSEAPTLSLISIAYDLTPAYFDILDDGRTDILFTGESNMFCRWSSSDVSYSSMSNDCSISGTTGNCSITGISEGVITRYISCQDSLGNEHNSSNNFDVSFTLDYTAPTTNDNSAASAQVPIYSVTITEYDNVDLDPTTYYCTSQIAGCTPTTLIDSLGTISYSNLTRGINYLRYYSIDDAGNTQQIVNKTILINQLPIFTSASDNALTLKGGRPVNVSTISYDTDSTQDIILYVCASSTATSSGCTSGHYCNATGNSNLSCVFNSELDSSIHNWYAFIFDDLDESSLNNSISGTYTTDYNYPNITLSFPTNASTITQNSLTIDITTNEPLTNAWYSLNNGINVSFENNSLLTYTHSNNSISDGNYNLTLWANDSYGNLANILGNYFIISTVPVDTTAPIITLNSPTNASYNSANLIINITSNEVLNWSGYILNYESILNLTRITPTNWEINLNLTEESFFNLTIFANDSSNNQANKTIIFYTDSRPPRYSNLVINPNPSNQSQDVNCSISWQDGFNITSAIISENSLGSYENHTISVSGNTGLANYLISGAKLANAGTYTCKFYATDIAGNTNSTSQNFSVNDVILPTIIVTSPSNATYNQQNITLSLVVSEAANSAWYSFNGSNFTMSNSSTNNWNATLLNLANGAYYVKFYVNDSSGNLGNSSTIYFSINTGAGDTIPPVINLDTILNSSYQTSTNLELNITSNENTIWAGYILNSEGLRNMSNSSLLKWNSTLSNLGGESTNTLWIYVNDTSNNQGNVNIAFYVDTIAPRFLNLSSTPNIANESQSITCSVYINDSFSLTRVTLRENATLPGTFLNHTLDLSSSGWANYTISNVKKGAYACIFYATDIAANTNSTQSNFIVNDVTAPILTIVSPFNQTYNTNSILLSITLNENASSALYSFDSGETNYSITGSGTVWSTVVNKITGSHNVTFFINDTSNNLVSNSIVFSVDISIYDFTAPRITIWTPTNASYFISANVLLNITTDESLIWAGYILDSDPINSLDNVSTASWNKTLNLIEGQHNITFYANDSSTNKNQANSSVSFHVDLTNPLVSNFTCMDVNDSENVNCTYVVSDSIGLDYLIIGHNATGNWQNSSIIDLTGKIYTGSYIIYEQNTSPGIFQSQIYVYDLAGRNNLTIFDDILIADDTLPEITNITYWPNTSDLLDPGVTINITTDILEDYYISSVVLMYKESADLSWNHLAMSNTAQNNYNASFIATNGTWIFKINATDLAGNQRLSPNTTLNVVNDTSFYNSTDILTRTFSYTQLAVNNSLGQLCLNNTGDENLEFNINITSAARTRFNLNDTGTPNATYLLFPGEAINLTLYFDSRSLTETVIDYIISITTSGGNSTFEKQVRIVPENGPALDLELSPATSIVERGSNVQFTATVTNIGTQESYANDVELIFNLPEGVSLISGNLTKLLNSIGWRITQSSTITLLLDEEISSSSILINITANSSNADSEYAYSTLVISNPYIIQQTPSSNLGGGSSGSSIGGGKSVVYSKIIEVTRGERMSFYIEVNNKYTNSTLKDLVLNMSGFPEKYFIIAPNKISKIEPGKSDYFLVVLTAPTYKSYEEHDLKALITGSLVSNNGVESYQETQNIKLIIQEVSFNKTNFTLLEAEKAILQMNNNGFNIQEANLLLEQAKAKLADHKNKESFDLSTEILAIKEKSEGVNNLIRRIAEALQDPKNSYLLIGEGFSEFKGENKSISLNDLLNEKSIFASPATKELLDLAIVAFERGDYALAEERAKSAQLALLLERKGNLLIFLYLYWPYVLLTIVLMLILIILGFKIYKKNSITRKIEDIDREENNIMHLMAPAQRDYFAGKMSAGEYHRIMNQHQDKLAKIKQERLTLRNKRIKLLSPQKIIQDTKLEGLEVENEVKKLQSQYYKDHKISENEYNTEFNILNERLAEIEEEKITLNLLDKKNISPISKKQVESIKDKNSKSFFEKIRDFFNPFNHLARLRAKKRAQEDIVIMNKINQMLGKNE